MKERISGIVGIIGRFLPDSSTTEAHTAQPSASLVFEEPAGGLERDASAHFVKAENTQADSDTYVRFECGEFQTPVSIKRPDMFFYYDRLQIFEPVQVAVHDNKEWWWFRNNVYKVEFEEGRPSADLAADIAVDGWPDKTSLVPEPDAHRQGYSRDEIAEGVFELQGKTETALEHADRLDVAHTITVQVAEASTLHNVLVEQDTPHDLGLDKDESARVFVDKSWWRASVCMESNVHQPRQVLVNDDTVFQTIPELQKYHPILLDKKHGRGKYWRSGVVAEWWCFRGDIYLAKREIGYQSEALSLLKESVSRVPRRDKSAVWIPKWTVGNEFGDLYEEGYAPEEVVQLISALMGKRESLEEMFDRVRAAKTALGNDSTFRTAFQLPWDETREGFNRQQVEEYLQERKLESAEGIREARAGGYWFSYKEWDRKRRKEFWSRGDDVSGATSPWIMGNYSVSHKPKREHIPKSVKMYVWQRDEGRCVNCGSNEKLEYDHIIPFSKGGSNTERNLQLLCERCNRAKSSSIA